MITAMADPPIGSSLEESPEALRLGAAPILYGSREIFGLSRVEADLFAAALAE